jgi:hypothetical protein
VLELVPEKWLLANSSYLLVIVVISDLTYDAIAA